ncbi:MAG: DNA recombination/repair protein RecA [Acidobacteria bacterium]|nr:DNA recombination/repair protein RecA [Acidobacteriota bacterium]
MGTAATLRTQIESQVRMGARLILPSLLPERRVLETVSTGIAEVDALTGGVPRGALTEICGPASSGRTSLLLSLLATATARGEVCALVDASDTFDPHSAAAAGVELKKLLWVRGKTGDRRQRAGGRGQGAGGSKNRLRESLSPVEHALRATDLLLAAGGFGVVVLDLGDVAPTVTRRILLTSWFRFRRTVENTPTVLVALEQEPSARTCASLVLRLGLGELQWSVAAKGDLAIAALPNFRIDDLPRASMLTGLRVFAEVERSRVWPGKMHPMATAFGSSAMELRRRRV